MSTASVTSEPRYAEDFAPAHLAGCECSTCLGLAEAAIVNPECPDYFAHYEEALDALFPAPTQPLTLEESEAVEATAEAAYLRCLGH